MDRDTLFLLSGLGGLGTTLLYLAPIPYQYPPAIAALSIAIGMQCSPTDGVKLGALIGVWAGFGAVLISIALVAVPDAISNSGAANLVRAMEGMGPRNAFFYAVFAYFVGVYTALTGSIVGGIAGLANQGVGRVLDRAPETPGDDQA